MFEQSPKQAVIVYRAKEEEYAHLLANLISTSKVYEVAEWEEKDWLANKASTSSSQKMIFLGDTKAAHKRYIGMVWVYNQHNMKYGWLGNQCIIDVDPLSIDNIKGFCDYYQEKYVQFNKLAEHPELFLLCNNMEYASIVTNENETSVSEEIVDIENKPESKIKPVARLATFFSNNNEGHKDNLIKLSTNAVKPIKDHITKGKLIKYQYSLLVFEFVYNGGLEKFMEG